MPTTGWIAVVLAALLGGWLAFDGTRALLTGDYVTPSTGDYAGQLGPWAKLVQAVGLDPRSTAVKLAHVILGACWIVAAVCFAARVPASWTALVACAVCSLWYAPFGTLVGVAELVLLMLPALRTVTAS